MTTTHKIELESIFLISIVAAASLFFVVQSNNQGLSVPAVLMNSPLITIPATAPKQNIFSQISPDGTKKVIMKIFSGNDNAKTYTFYTTDDSGINEQFIFEKTLDTTANMTIPFNTFSPDNKYFFIQKNSEAGISILAFQTSGEPFSGTEAYFDVTDLFKKKETGNNFKEATGWASESLIIINTAKGDGTKGPSYWFEIPSRAIIQLSTEF